MYIRNTWDATDVIRTIVVFSFTLLCYFLSANVRVDLRHFYEPVSFWLDDRLTREFTYLYMSSRDSIFIKIVQFIQGFYCEGAHCLSFRALIISENSFLIDRQLLFIFISFKNHILLSPSPYGWKIELAIAFASERRNFFFIPIPFQTHMNEQILDENFVKWKNGLCY